MQILKIIFQCDLPEIRKKNKLSNSNWKEEHTNRLTEKLRRKGITRFDW